MFSLSCQGVFRSHLVEGCYTETRPNCCWWEKYLHVALQMQLSIAWRAIDTLSGWAAGQLVWRSIQKDQIEQWRKINGYFKEEGECGAGKGEEGESDRGDKDCSSVDPEAPMRGLSVGKQGRRVINLAGLACPSCLVSHWVCSGGPLHQRRAAAAAAAATESCSACNKSSSEREICQGEVKKHFMVLWLPHLCMA